MEGRLGQSKSFTNQSDWGNPSHLLIKKEASQKEEIKMKQKIKIKIKQPIKIKQTIKIKQAKKAIKQAKKAIKQAKKVEQLLIRKAEPLLIRDASVSTDTRLSQYPYPGRPVRPMDPLPICEICGANHWWGYCSYLDSMPPDAKPIDETKFQIVCRNCGWYIVNEACPNYCSPTLTRVSRKLIFAPRFTPIKHLSKDPFTDYAVNCLPPQQVPSSYSGKQKEASVSTETQNTIKDLSAPPGSNSSSQERKTYPSRFPKSECFKMAYSGYQVPWSYSGKQKEASVSTETPNTILFGSNSSSQERNTHPLPFKL